MIRFGFLLVLLTNGLSILGQDFSNKGKEFWLGYGNHQQMYAGNQQGMDVYITSDVNTTALVEIPGTGFSQNVTVNANQVVSITIPQNAILNIEGKENKGIHVKAEKPVVVYAHIYFASVSGATLCLPVSTLGREYYSVNFTQVAQPNLNSNSYSYFFVVATEDNTTVEITPSALTSGGRAAGVAFTENLNRGEVYQVLSNTDLTGSTIRSLNTGTGCKKIAVFSGAGRIGIGCPSPNQISSDNLYQQMYPTTTWGKKYITVPSVTRPRNFYRIIRPDPTATVRLNGTVLVPGSFISNLYYEFEGSSTNVIESDKPILVAQYFTTQNCGEATQNGDPEMIYLNPLEQTISDVTLTSMRLINVANQKHYLNVVLKNQPGIIQSFRLDGVPYTNFQPLAQDPGYAYAQIEVTQGTHRLKCDSGFNAIAYGFANFESYGYSAGTNLRDLYQFITIDNVYGTVNFPAGCRNSPFTFSIVFPYQPVKIQWQFNGLFNDTTINNPVYDSTWVVNDRRLYRYKINRPYTITAIGTYPITIVATNPTTDGCGGEQEIDYDLQIFDRPEAKFTYTNNGCINDSVRLFDATTITGGRPVISWNWDLGDNTRSTVKNPAHLYASGGDYPVKFSVITDIGCLSDTTSQTISLSNIPVADFTLAAPVCAGRPFTLSSQSLPGTGTLSRFTWNMGDGNTITRNNGDPFTHVYATPGNYNIKLTVQNDRGCISPVDSLSSRAGFIPDAAFSLPEVCLSDAFAQFNDSSTIADGTAGQFTYAWNLGDGTLSTDKNPRHKYNAAANYVITEVVTSNLGCIDTLVRNFTVNGAVPNAGFTVQNAGVLCSNQEISISNNSSVDFGSITRLVIYWDAVNNPGQSDVDETPTPNKIYRHTYQDFGTPVSKSFTIRFVAYSGQSCVSEQTRLITVQASPQITFDPLNAVCEEIDPYQLTAARENAGLAGTGIFSGAGISPTGIFDPGSARPGSHTLRYTFNTSAGCSSFKEQTIQVNATPRVDAGPDRGVLEGGFIIINGTSTGTGLRVNWTPPTGLSDPSILTPRATPIVDTRYLLEVTTGQGCSASDEVFVKVLLKPVIPNTFTPNGDGYNDFWDIKSLDTYPGCIVEVYNTAGSLVYRSVGYNKPWDGTWNGKPLAAGTYYYVIDPKNERGKIAGYVTIFK